MKKIYNVKYKGKRNIPIPNRILAEYLDEEEIFQSIVIDTSKKNIETNKKQHFVFFNKHPIKILKIEYIGKVYSEELPRKIRNKGNCQFLETHGTRCNNKATREKYIHEDTEMTNNWYTIYVCDQHFNI